MTARHSFVRHFLFVVVVAISYAPVGVSADSRRDEHHAPAHAQAEVRYLALGDSLAAGYRAMPATQGYVYRLYRAGVIAPIERTLFANAAVPGVTSAQVLAYQVPQALDAFPAEVITLSVGGNDLLRIMNGADPGVVLGEFQTNLTLILQRLRSGLPRTRVYINNLYTIPNIAGADAIVPVFNQILTQVAGAFGVPVADIYSAFLGRPELLLINRPGAGAQEVHPTNAGYAVMAREYARIMQRDD